MKKNVLLTKKVIDLGMILNLSYEDIKKKVKGIVDEAKSEGIDIDSKILYNSNTGLVELEFTRRL